MPAKIEAAHFRGLDYGLTGNTWERMNFIYNRIFNFFNVTLVFKTQIYTGTLWNR